MEILQVLNLIALIVIPILVVVISQHLQDRAEKRKDKMSIFKILMTSRIYGWTVESVHALNVLDIVFSDDKPVREAWKDLYDKYCVDNPSESDEIKIRQAQYKLLEVIANSLGYKGKITWETIQNPYIPDGMRNQMLSHAQTQRDYEQLLSSIKDMVPGNGK